MTLEQPRLHAIDGDGQALKEAVTAQLIRWAMSGREADRIRLLELDRQVAPRGRLRLVGGTSSQQTT